MGRRPRHALIALAVALVHAPAAAPAQSAEQNERIGASFVLAFGRTPTAGEAGRLASQGPMPISGLIARHREQLQTDRAAERAVIVKAGQDAFGVAPGDDVIGGLSGTGTYLDLMARHLAWLAGRPAEYEQVMRRAYRLVLRRDAYAIEIDYWKARPTLSFALLAACVDNWARRNQPGLMATTGAASVSINSAYLSTTRLSPAIAAEARTAAGLDPADAGGGAALGAALGLHVVAPGAAHVVSVGGIHFAAAGAIGAVAPGQPPDGTRSR